MGKFVKRNIQRVEEKYIKQLSQYDVATIYEAQGKLGLLNPEIKPIQQGELIIGNAVTATCFAGDNLMIHAAIEVCNPGDVLIITTIGESKSGMIGELIVEALRKRGVVGVVIDAGVRDTERIRQLGFPIWSKAVHAEGTTKNKGGWVNNSVVCGGTTINPGDVVMADDDGVVVIEQDRVEEVIGLAKLRMEKEAKVLERIANGELSLDFYNLRGVLEAEGVEYID